MDVAGLEKTQLRDSDGAIVRLGDLWKERPTVLVFARHFG